MKYSSTDVAKAVAFNYWLNDLPLPKRVVVMKKRPKDIDGWFSVDGCWVREKTMKELWADWESQAGSANAEKRCWAFACYNHVTSENTDGLCDVCHQKRKSGINIQR